METAVINSGSSEANDDDQHRRRRRQFWILVGTLNILLIVVIVILAITLPESDDEPQQVPAPTMVASMAPSNSPTKEQEWPDLPPVVGNDDPPTRPITYQEYASDLLAALRGEDSYMAGLEEDDAENLAVKRALDWMLQQQQQLETYEVGRTLPAILMERFVLAIFYYSTNGPNWTYEWEDGPNYLSDVFLGNTSVCDWHGLDGIDDQGVFCDDESRVVGLESNNKFNGTIPTELGSATSLSRLHFSLGGFSGRIPTELAALTNLISINFDTNDLTGGIPTEILSLQFLRDIDTCEFFLSLPNP
eukprot:scaffold8505_cov130-Cylindrotheca_fusiformis.AAC.20